MLSHLTPVGYTSDDILALAAAVYLFIKLHLSPQQRYPRTLPELLTAVAALLTRQQPDDAPVRHNACTIRSHMSNSGCWNSWAMNWQPSRPWLGLTSFVGSPRQQQRPQSNSFSLCSPHRFLRRLCQSGCRGSLSEFPVLYHLYSLSGRRGSWVRCCALLVAARLVRFAVNSLLALSIRLSLVRSRSFFDQPRHSTLLFSRFVSVFAQCLSSVLRPHCRIRTVRGCFVWVF